MYHQIHTHLCIRHGVQTRIIYISVVNFFFNFYFYFGVFGLKYTHPIFFSTIERVGLGFFFFGNFI